MVVDRLEVRVDAERRRKLKEMADEQGAPVSETVRRLIDSAYEQTLVARRKRAALELGQLEIEDVPDPESLAQQLDGAYESGVH